MRDRSLILNISNSSSDEDLIKVAKQVAEERRPEDICDLAHNLSISGLVIDDWPSTEIADIPSTGGPFSLSTLLCPLILAAAGCYVPKLGVPGRPAGGIDCMLQLSGYRAEFDEVDLKSILTKSNYAHFLSGGRFAPLDARMFALRQEHNLQSIPELATASILSKKLAVGIRKVGLDIRVAPWGNFGKNFDEAQEAADVFKKCSTILGLEAFTFLTDATKPYQPYLGRSESLLAMLKVLDGSGEELLNLHAEDCRQMALTVSQVKKTPTWEEAKTVLANHLESQGSSLQELMNVAARTEALHSVKIYAPISGIFFPNIPQLRNTILEAQKSILLDSKISGFPDPMGLKLLAGSGEFIEKQMPIASIRASKDMWEKFGALIESSLIVLET